MTKSRVFAVLKWSFSLAIVFVLLRSGKISPDLLSTLWGKPQYSVFCLILLFCLYFMNALRWKILLLGAGFRVKFLDSFKLSMLGQFFSVFLPGAVGGDLIKAVYVARRFPERRVATVSTVFIDRVIGLSSLLILASTAFLSLVFFQPDSPVSQNPALFTGGVFLVVYSGVFLLGTLLFSFFGRHLPEELPGLFSKLPMKDRFQALYSLILAYRKRKALLWWPIVMSLFSQAVNVLASLIVAVSIYSSPPWGLVGIVEFCLGSMIGLTATAVPLFPMGVGVGQAAYFEIFKQMGVHPQAFGATVITGFQLYYLLTNLSGVIFYLSYKHQVQELDLEPQS